MKHITIGTAGHIDHGKSALVEALTGTHPDRLEEEKRRGITIDLGFAFTDLEGMRLGFVDVPGHERFVKNMLAGIGGIDLALLVVAADEGIKPQTREHFDICRLLGIPRGLTVMTKSDLVDADTLGLVRLELEEFLRGSFLERAPLLAVSARNGAGVATLREALAAAARAVPGRDICRYFRQPIDRSFAMKGFGAVVTGTVVSGAVSPEDEVELFPARRRLRVRGIHSGGAAVERATAGQRAAINLAGIGHGEVARGMTLAAPGIFELTRQMDVRISLLPSARPLKNRARVHFHHGTGEQVAEVVLVDGARLEPGAAAYAQLRLAVPLVAQPGDRFILRQFSPVVTIGGGLVLDPLAPRHRAKDLSPTPLLAAFESGRRETIVAELLARAPGGLAAADLLARTGWLLAEALAAAQALAQDKVLRILSQQPLFVVSAAALDQCARDIAAELARFHKANPLAEGLPKEDLRERVAARLQPQVFRAALEQAVAAGQVAVAGDLAKLAGREIALTPEEARAREQIEAAFAKAGLTVPPVKEVVAGLGVDPRRAQKIVQILLRERTLVRASEDLLFHRSALERLRQLLADYKKQRGDRLPIGTFKELAGITRKYAIPLLEYLDRERVTRRAGDERVIL